MHVLLGQLSEQSLSIDSLFPQLIGSRAKARIDGLQESRELLKTELLTSHLEQRTTDKCLSRVTDNLSLLFVAGQNNV